MFLGMPDFFLSPSLHNTIKETRSTPMTSTCVNSITIDQSKTTRERKRIMIHCWILLSSAVMALAQGQGCQTENIDNSTGIICSNIVDLDLPYDMASGVYDFIEISNSPDLTRIPRNPFGSASAIDFRILNNDGLQSLDDQFLGSNLGYIERIQISGNPTLSDFNWNLLPGLVTLKSFEFSSSNLTELATDLQWPPSVEEINFSGNKALVDVPRFAFRNALGLKTLNMSDLSGQTNLKEEAFNILSSNSPTLILTANEGPFDGVIEKDAFGNVLGGELWGRLEMTLWDFPELTFRLMLKSNFDLGFEELIYPVNGPTAVKDCNNCSIAWLYKDAQVLGKAQYQKLIGDGNVVCPGVGPVLETGDADFIQQMNDCPRSDMPWPGDNPCRNHTDITADTVADPVNCECFYQCTSQDISGHKCCDPPLVFNPISLVCDWDFNVPSCQP